MFSHRRGRIFLIVAVIFGLTLATIDIRGGGDGGASSLRSGATAVFSPVQVGVRWFVSPISNATRSVRELTRIRRDNHALRDRLEVLEQRVVSRRDLERENAELRALLAMRDRTSIDTVPARTIAISPSNFEWIITIDVGRVDGVERNMPVVNGDGLVGRIYSVGERSSRVIALIDPNFSVTVRSASSGHVGVLDGRGADPLSLRLLDSRVEMAAGDEIVTSSFDAGLYPESIPVGVVRSVQRASSQLITDVLVNPYVDFTRLGHVLVLRTSPVEEPPPFVDTDQEVLPRPQDSANTNDGGTEGANG
ncbi:MAG: rod shape-determining protein MreC [Nitriliruptoraceae bacterium]